MNRLAAGCYNYVGTGYVVNGNGNTQLVYQVYIWQKGSVDLPLPGVLGCI